MASDCIFCKIAAGEADGKIIYQDEYATAFWDKRPRSPIHILIIPNKYISSVNEVEEQDEAILGHMFTIAKKIAKEQDVHQSGYRLSINTGPDAGQSVFHIHMHLIAGRPLPIFMG